MLDDFQIGNCVTFEFFYSLTSLQVPEGDSGVCAAGEEDTPVCGEVEVHDGSSVTCHYCNILTFSVDVPQDCNEYQFLHEATQQIKLFKLIVEFFIDLFLCGIKNIINDILLWSTFQNRNGVQETNHDLINYNYENNKSTLPSSFSAKGSPSCSISFPHRPCLHGDGNEEKS